MARTDVLIVAPPGVRISIRTRGDPPEVHLFESIDHFDRWRRANSADAGCLGACVDRAVEEIHAAAESSLQLTSVLSWLRSQPQVPCLKQLAEAVTSRRSFFRLWLREMNERPSQFLSRLRAHFARQLLAAGQPLDGAAQRAGYPSVNAMNRAIAAHGTTCESVAPRRR
jgi:AraC-like DNA-binding protein